MKLKIRARSDQPRDRVKPVRLNKNEQSQIHKAANIKGMKPTTFMAWAIMGVTERVLKNPAAKA